LGSLTLSLSAVRANSHVKAGIPLRTLSKL
jgi:hypothetical protein